MFTVTREDRRELRHLVASVKFGFKLALSVAVLSVIGLIGTFSFGGIIMVPTLVSGSLDLIWGR